MSFIFLLLFGYVDWKRYFFQFLLITHQSFLVHYIAETKFFVYIALLNLVNSAFVHSKWISKESDKVFFHYANNILQIFGSTVDSD